MTDCAPKDFMTLLSDEIATHGGAFLAEIHDGLMSDWVRRHAKSLAEAGCETMFVECLTSANQPHLDAFQRGELPAQALTDLMASERLHLDAQAMRRMIAEDSANYAPEDIDQRLRDYDDYMQTLAVLAEQGIRLVALDCLPDHIDDVWSPDGSVKHKRLTDSNPHWLGVIRGELAARPVRGYMVWGGAAHASWLAHDESPDLAEGSIDVSLKIPSFILCGDDKPYPAPEWHGTEQVAGVSTHLFFIADTILQGIDCDAFGKDVVQMVHYARKKEMPLHKVQNHQFLWHETQRDHEQNPPEYLSLVPLICPGSYRRSRYGRCAA